MDYEDLEIVNNKFNLLTRLKITDIDVPEFLVVKDLVGFDFGLGQLGYPQKILCFKPTLGNGSRGFQNA
jgi:carbamoyl-phosphate synthase large subunit